ncbi:MAG TPA: S24 family peptidase [Patescibacteria group bacterium]|nr:S24 family peptidase [Patescibacteria group bacterium]
MDILTPKQKIVLQAVREFMAENGQMPTIRELQVKCADLGLKLKSTRSIFFYLKSLEENGLIRRTKTKKGSELASISKENFMDIPIFGMTSAGSATMFAEQSIIGYLKISKRLFKREDIFAIKVAGDSMNLSVVNRKRIEDGDFIIVDPNYSTFHDGDKVLVVIDGLATVKIFKKIDNKTIALIPQSTNKKHQPIYLTPEDEFVFNGKVIDVLKLQEYTAV